MKRRCAIGYLVSILAVALEVRAKSLIFSKYAGPHYEGRKQTVDFDYDELQDNDHLDNVYGYMRSMEDIVHPFKRSIFGSTKKRSPYGLVYNQGKPIGILEPIGQAFEYASYPSSREVGFRNTGLKSQWYPAKRESSDFDMSEMERENIESQSTPLHSSHYANVLAKFKVNNKVKQRPYQDFMYAQQVKRDVTMARDNRQTAESGNFASEFGQREQRHGGTRSLLDETSSTGESETTVVNKDERDDMKKRGALDLGDLGDKQSVLKTESVAKTATKVKRTTNEDQKLSPTDDEVGLVEKENTEPQKDGNGVFGSAAMRKREIYFEDEDLENGLNKIGLTKESHYDRNKKEDGSGKAKIVTKSLKNMKKTKVEKSIHKKGKKKSKKESDEPKQRIAKSPKKSKIVDGETMRVANYQVEGEEFLRKKRQAAKEGVTDDADIMRGLEVSGDLTVSGNKSPLVAVSNDETEKKSQEKRDKEELEYEKRLERNIEAKINAIKEEVKREIGQQTSDGSQRKKREISSSVSSNLMDEESSVLDPGVNIEGDLEPHIRRRRNANSEADKRVASDSTKFRQRGSAEEEEESSISGKIGVDPVSKGLESEDQTTGGLKVDDDNLINKNDDGERFSAIMDDDKGDDGEALKMKSEDSLLLIKRQQPTDEESDSEQKDKPLDKRSSYSGIDSSRYNEKEENAIDESNENNNKGGSLAKRNENNVTLTDENDKSFESKIVLKREADIATTDKIEVETAAPESVVKRDGESVKLTAKERKNADAIIADANGIVKRNEEPLVTEKFVAPREGPEPIEFVELDPKDDQRLERSVEMKSQGIATGQTVMRNEEDKSSMRFAKDLNHVGEESAGKQITPERSINKLLDSETLNENLRKRSVEDSKLVKRDLSNRSIALNSAILHEQELEKEGETYRKARKVKEDDKDESNFEARNENPEELEIAKRRRRSLYNEMMMKNGRRKRDDNWNNVHEAVGYRAEDGEIDDEDDENQDDDFQDQTSNMVNKRQVADVLYESSDEQDAQDYPTYIERNKRNALRLYDDETGADESFDNFLFYPSRYSRHKRHEGDRDEDGGSSALSTRINDQRTRRKRLERQRQQQREALRLRESSATGADKGEMASLSEADIFGGLPQSYEGELSRFKRVKRSGDVDG